MTPRAISAFWKRKSLPPPPTPCRLLPPPSPTCIRKPTVDANCREKAKPSCRAFRAICIMTKLKNVAAFMPKRCGKSLCSTRTISLTTATGTACFTSAETDKNTKDSRKVISSRSRTCLPSTEASSFGCNNPTNILSFSRPSVKMTRVRTAIALPMHPNLKRWQRAASKS